MELLGNLLIPPPVGDLDTPAPLYVPPPPGTVFRGEGDEEVREVTILPQKSHLVADILCNIATHHILIIHVSVHPSIYPSVCLPTYLSIWLTANQLTYLPTY